jgi:hypothetical protein
LLIQILIEFPGEFDIHIVVREWIDIDPAMEFRGFMYNRQLTAISQYCYYQFFPKLQNAKSEIQRKITDFFETIKSKIPQEHAVVDFVVLADSVKVIELNPFVCALFISLSHWGLSNRI